MKLPRIVAITSATTAAGAAFLVASRWGILGTVAGAIVMAAVYTLVSHFSTETLDRAGTWMRRRLRPGASPPEETDAERSLSSSTSRPGADGRPSTPNRTGRALAWTVPVVALLSLGASIYSVSIAGRDAQPVFMETVVERTVVVTDEGDGDTGQADRVGGATHTQGAGEPVRTEGAGATIPVDGGVPAAPADQSGSVAPSTPSTTTSTIQTGEGAAPADVNTEASPTTGGSVPATAGPPAPTTPADGKTAVDTALLP